MTAIHVAQIVLGGAAAFVVAARVRALGFQAPLGDSRSSRSSDYVGAVRAAHRQGDESRLRFLLRSGQAAWSSRVLSAICFGGAGNADEERALDDVVHELRYEARRGLWVLRGFARIGTLTALLGALWEVLTVSTKKQSILGLKAGFVETVAIENASLALAMGISITGFCWACAHILQRQATQLLDEVLRMEEVRGLE